VHGEALFFQAFIYLSAAVVSVPIAKRLGLGSVLGYLIAGVVIGPFALDLVGDRGQDVMNFAEFGVVMMLFVIGLELQPQLLWRMRGPILGLGGLQVTATAACIAVIALASGHSWQVGLALGMTLALSSTAIVLQSLTEKGLLRTDSGQASFAVLLFQDIAVIPMLALMPLLASATGHGEGGAHGANHGGAWVAGLPGWGKTLAVLGAVGAIVLAGRFLVQPAFRFIARTRLREIFTAAALLLVIGTALLMTRVGLSPALGAFLAGVVLANSEYRHELETDIEPFKGMLLGLFFIAVGASIDFGLITSQPASIAAKVACLVLLKFAILFVLGRAFRMGLDQNLLFAFALAQGGEFGFVLFAFAAQNGVIAASVASPWIVSIALSMGLTPLLLLLHEKLLRPRLGTRERQRATDAIEAEENPVIMAGFGRFGHVVGRLLLANKIGTTVLDLDSDHVDLLRKLGFKVFFGDASRHDLLRAAGAEQAKLMIVAIDDVDRSLELVRLVQKHFPHLTILARAFGRPHAYELLDAGVDHVYRETLDTSLRLGADALRMLGHRSYQAQRAAKTFRRHDEESVRELAAMRHDRGAYLNRARDRIRHLEEVLQADLAVPDRELDAAWETVSLRSEPAPQKPEGSDAS